MKRKLFLAMGVVVMFVDCWSALAGPIVWMRPLNLMTAIAVGHIVIMELMP